MRLPATPTMSGPKLIDAHCHLDFEVFDADRKEVLQRAANNNICDIIIPATHAKYWPRLRALCESNTNLHPCYGLHPYWVAQHDDDDLKRLAEIIESSRPVAVGECGLDFRPQQADKTIQLKFFESQLELAQQYQLPVVIHSVKATETVIQILKKHHGLKGMVHAYSGSSEQARQLIDMDFHISVGGSVSYERAAKLKKVVRDIPLTSLLLETDAPDQPGAQHQGERNEPAYLIDTLRAVAALREETIDVIAAQTTLNAQKLFRI